MCLILNRGINLTLLYEKDDHMVKTLKRVMDSFELIKEL